MINVFEPSVGAAELSLIKEAIESKWLGKGKFVSQFEEMFALHLGVSKKHLTTTTCATEALFRAAELYKFNSGDEVVAPSISFVAAGSSVIKSGAHLRICDVDPHTLNTDINKILSVITPRTKAIIINHYGGIPTEMNDIIEFCQKNDIKVIEDAACAIDATYYGVPCGTMGDMGLWSFDSMKTITTGDGGLIFLRNPEEMETLKETLYLGTPARSKSGMDNMESGAERWWEYEIRRPGHRAIMNNIAGAIGVAQMQRFDKLLERRREIVKRYDEGLSGIDRLRLKPKDTSHIKSSPYLYWVQCDERDKLAKYLLTQSIYCTFRYYPLHKIKLFTEGVHDLPGAESAAARTLNIPLHASLSDDDVQVVIDSIRSFFRNF